MSSRVKIYTRTGDRGETSLYGGKRTGKDSLRVEAYGTVDELNSVLGMVIAFCDDKVIKEFLLSVQKDLFKIGAVLAGANEDISILKRRVNSFEQFIDGLDGDLPELRNFILPGGRADSATAHFARSVVRRAERKLVQLSKEENIDSNILVYFNRLSDVLFIIGRWLNWKHGVGDIVWKRT
ncbi:cob(I)yrinic acid a,c-diamide adenosyltransferase [Candidatus Gottesmanbacteria bacterium]|nr:cob(I)yrinic acid a,c-diamide adenosyltransferase [Candidatus Gottesmanbacteria bacterium]